VATPAGGNSRRFAHQDDLGSSSLSDDNSPNDDNRLQSDEFTAGFHFAFIEQGGTSLYASLAQKA